MLITRRQKTPTSRRLLPSSQSDIYAALQNTNKFHLGGKDKASSRKLRRIKLSDKLHAAVAAIVFISFFLTPVLLSLRRGKQAQLGPSTANDGPVPKPWGWHLWGYYGFKQAFNCQTYLNDRTKPVPTMEDWETMLEAYNKVVDPTYKFDDEIPPTQGYRLNKDGAQPYYAKLSPGKGRGLFATRDIQKGEIVHDGAKSDIVFTDGMSWRRFMFALPRKMACDTAEWTFTQQFEEDGPMRVVSSLNIAILMNEGNTVNEVNVQPQNESGEPSEYSVVFYAMRDIKKDEEILMDYDDYTTDYVAAGIGYQGSRLYDLLNNATKGWNYICQKLGVLFGV